jgi:hypothetical protein
VTVIALGRKTGLSRRGPAAATTGGAIVRQLRTIRQADCDWRRITIDIILSPSA